MADSALTTKTTALVAKIKATSDALTSKFGDMATDEELATRAPAPTVSTSAPSGGKNGDIWFQI